MADALQFAMLGFGMGSIYAILACGLVLIYRGSGTINLAHGHVALASAFALVELRGGRGLDTWVAVPLVLALAGLFGALVHLVVMYALRHSSPISRLIATLGLLTILNECVLLRFGATQQQSAPLLPTDPVHWGPVVFGAQSIYLVVTATVVAVVLRAVDRHTRWGKAIAAAAENQRAAAALGWSPHALAVATWSAGGALAALAGMLVPSVTGGYFSSTSLSLLIVGALAAALLAQFRSYPAALVGGWLIAVVQSEAVRYVDVTGLGDAVPFVFIVLFLVARGRGLPVRGTAADRLPKVGNGRPRLVPLLLGAAALVWCLQVRWALEFDLLQGVVISTSFAVVGLSVVVLTGYAGQLSLAQMGLAGLGAWVAGRLVDGHGWTFATAVPAGVVAAAMAGVVLGLPALRTRGVNLAVVTFGLGFALHAVIFSNSSMTGGTAQTVIPSQTVLGIPVDPLLNLDNYASLCVLVLTGVIVVVGNLRRGPSGRKLLSVRANERAAASIGVNVFGVKLYAFTVASAIAGLGGILLAFSYSTILYQQTFSPFASISVVTIVVIGGIGWVAGPLVGSLLVTGGIGVLLASDLSATSERYVGLIGGVLLLVLLAASQDGVVAGLARIVPVRLRALRVRRAPTRIRPSTPAPPLRLRVAGLTQRFGGVTALDDVSLSIEPGRVLGLLGPNGAGKTTLIDAVTGYARPASGEIRLGDDDITRWPPARRARAGLTRTFQSLELFDDLTVRENLVAAADRSSAWCYLTDLFLPRRERLTDRAAAVLQDLGLSEVLDRMPDELSYGQRRLLAIARAVATGPSVLLLDEPAAGLDETESAELGQLVRRLADEWGMAVLLVEHDVAMVLQTSDEVLVIDYGREIFCGAPEDVGTDPTVRDAYLGLPAEETV